MIDLANIIARETSTFRDRVLSLIDRAASRGLLTEDGRAKLTNHIVLCVMPLVQEDEIRQLASLSTPVGTVPEITTSSYMAGGTEPLVTSCNADNATGEQSSPPSLPERIAFLTEADSDDLHRILRAFVDSYAPEVNPETSAIEQALVKNRSIDILVIHAPLGEDASAAVGFELVSRHMARTRLTEEERGRLASINLNSEDRPGVIILELSPRILIRNEVVHAGRAVTT